MKLASFRLIAVAVFAWQSGAAQADCAYMNGAVCGAAGNGSISAIDGNVSIAQGAGIYPALVGKQFGVGSRILTGSNATAQANLGAGCFAPLGPSSVAIVTSQKGLTCLSQSGSRWGDYTAADLPTKKPGLGPVGSVDPPGPAPYDPGLIAAGVIAGGAGLVACAAWCFNNHGSVSP
jgi:hypothetical protein